MSNWENDAACRGLNTEMFFPPADENESRRPSPAAIAAALPAKRICFACPVVSDCLNWAIESGQRSGIFGGLTAYERRQLRQRHRNALAAAS